LQAEREEGESQSIFELKKSSVQVVVLTCMKGEQRKVSKQRWGSQLGNFKRKDMRDE
jgi:hypothetical protein